MNIGVNRVLSACPAWYTFADIIKSKLLTGRTPKILKTLELYPIGRQPTEVIKLFGDDRYEVDLAKHDLFKVMIDARNDVQAEHDNKLTPEDRKAFLDSFQNGLKIAANGTSYGVPNEFIVDDHLREVPTTVYFGGAQAKVKARLHSVGMDGEQEISDYKAEKAGGYYHPLGVLIPAAGRLMLGVAERLAADRGLTYAFCDTDSMAFCDYWQKYTREEFREKVKEITDWFQPLNPYKNDIRLFGFEKVNYKLEDYESGGVVKDEFEPLYCLAVSSKRYCLFNRDKYGLPVIRKASAHGLGDVMLPAVPGQPQNGMAKEPQRMCRGNLERHTAAFCTLNSRRLRSLLSIRRSAAPSSLILMTCIGAIPMNSSSLILISSWSFKRLRRGLRGTSPMGRRSLRVR